MSRSWASGWSSILPMNDLRETPTSSGKPSVCNAASSRKTRQSHSSQAIPGSRKNPMPGSSTMRCAGIPARRARARLSVNAVRMRCMGGPLAGVGSLAMRIAPAAVSASSGAMSGSCCRPLTSLTIRAPAPSAARAGRARLVSAEMGTETATAAASTAAASRSVSSSAETWVCRYGAVDMAPMSMISAPSLSSARAASATRSAAT